MKIAAIIPARGGSKGLPRKNIRLLRGNPLISYTISAALKCPDINSVIVSTEDSKIKEISLQWGAKVIDRPIELAEDDTETHMVVNHALDELKDQGNDFDTILLLQPTSPLRNENHISESINIYRHSGVEALISVCRDEHHPFKSFNISNTYLNPLFSEIMLHKPRNLLPKTYRQNGAIYIISVNEFKINRSFFLKKTISYLMDTNSSIDIDNQNDFDLAELIISKQCK
jgi:CMP-N,N'-diacetyllegionaminic acid synthase